MEILIIDLLSRRRLSGRRWRTHKRTRLEGDSQTPKFDIFLFSPCGRRRRSRNKKVNSKKKVQKKFCLRTMPYSCWHQRLAKGHIHIPSITTCAPEPDCIRTPPTYHTIRYPTELLTDWAQPPIGL